MAESRIGLHTGLSPAWLGTVRERWLWAWRHRNSPWSQLCYLGTCKKPLSHLTLFRHPQDASKDVMHTPSLSGRTRRHVWERFVNNSDFPEEVLFLASKPHGFSNGLCHQSPIPWVIRRIHCDTQLRVLKKRCDTRHRRR